MPSGTVLVECGGKQTFSCKRSRTPLKWIIIGLEGIDTMGPFLPRNVDLKYPRLTTSDTGDGKQIGESNITIFGFNESDKGAIIQCIDANDNTPIGMANISIRECVCTIHGSSQQRSLIVLHIFRGFHSAAPGYRMVPLLCWGSIYVL